MRREALLFPVLDEPILIMGMPPAPFLLATIVAVLVPALFRFHPLALAPLIAYPTILPLLRKHGRQDPKRFEIFIHFWLVERRFYHPASHVQSLERRRINRRALLP